MVSNAVRDAAVVATAAIPGLKTAGIDIMATSLESSQPIVLEINAFPHINLALHPMYGDPTDPLGAYIKAFVARDNLLRGVEDAMSNEGKAYVEKYVDFMNLKDDLNLRAMYR